MSDEPIGVIFDVDGVLVDSYRAHYESYVRIGGELGFEISEQDFVKVFGRTTRESIGYLGLDTKLGLTANDETRFNERKEALYRQIINDSFPAMAGAAELIDALHSDGFRLAVGSSGPPRNVDLVLQQLQRAEKFSGKVTGHDVTQGKPHPEVFLKAAQQLQLPAERCVVLEDAAPGIEAARAAGMRCVGFASTGHTRDELSRATLVIGTLAELTPSRLRELCQ